MINTSGNTLIIDIRDELSFEYGHIDGQKASYLL